MLSCLSPRRPCCGPNAAVTRRSPRATSASSECSRLAVTEPDAPAARRGVRPAAGAVPARRAAGRCRSSPWQGAVDLEHEARRSWKSGRSDGCASAQCETPPSLRSMTAARPSRNVESPAVRAVSRADDGLERDPVVRDAGRHARRRRVLERRHAFPVAGEAVERPLRRRREIELAIGDDACPAMKLRSRCAARARPSAAQARGRH